MAGVIGDDEESRATFINRKWIARKLHRSERWVTDNCKKKDMNIV